MLIHAHYAFCEILLRVEILQLFSTFFIFLRHPRVGGDPDGNRSEAITIFT